MSAFPRFQITGRTTRTRTIHCRACGCCNRACSLPKNFSNHASTVPHRQGLSRPSIPVSDLTSWTTRSVRLPAPFFRPRTHLGGPDERSSILRAGWKLRRPDGRCSDDRSNRSTSRCADPAGADYRVRSGIVDRALGFRTNHRGEIGYPRECLVALAGLSGRTSMTSGLPVLETCRQRRSADSATSCPCTWALLFAGRSSHTCRPRTL